MFCYTGGDVQNECGIWRDDVVGRCLMYIARLCMYILYFFFMHGRISGSVDGLFFAGVWLLFTFAISGG